MKTPALLLTLALGCAAPLASAGSLQAPSPYAGEQNRQIKALAPDRIEGLLAGRGLGYARAAELNGIPGPMHVLELADALDLTPQQRQATQSLYDSVQVQARALGTELVEAEAALDALFRAEVPDADAIQAQVQAIGAIDARLRHTHLAAHLAQKPLLSAEQIHRYTQLRGYHDNGRPQTAHGHTGH